MSMRTTSGNEVRGGGGSAVRTVRPVERRGPVRPGGRRSSSPLPPARPPVGGGSARPVAPALSPTFARRRRVAALLLAVALCAGVAVLVLAGVSSAAPAGGMPAGTVTVVEAGETLQDVARRTSPGADEQALAERIRDLNQLPSSSVAAGRPLVVPAG